MFKQVTVLWSRNKIKRKTYLCFTVVTVSEATLVVMFFAATSKPVHMVANPGQIRETFYYISHKQLSVRQQGVQMISTLHSAGSHHHGSVYVGSPILVFLHGLRDQLASVFFHVRRQLPTHAASDSAHPVHCSNTALLN